MTGSIPKYSAMPPQTPAIIRSSRDLYRRRGPRPVAVGVAVGVAVAAGSGPAGAPAGSVVGSWSCDSMASSVPVGGRAHHRESSLGDAPGASRTRTPAAHAFGAAPLGGAKGSNVVPPRGQRTWPSAQELDSTGWS